LRDFSLLAKEKGATLKLAYLEGRLLEEKAEWAQAAGKFEEVIAGDEKAAEPHLRLAECLRAQGKAGDAEARLREAVRALPDAAALWDLWFVLCAVDLKRGAKEILEILPAPEEPGADGKSTTTYAADLKWLLERMAEDERARINCGGEACTGKDGTLWGKDCFARGGDALEPHGYVPARATEVDVLKTGRGFPGKDSVARGYRIPLPQGRYRVTLGFAEVTFHEAGRRRFDVLLEGKKVLEDLEPKIDTPEVFTFEERVEDGHLDLEFVRKAEDPSISAIAIERMR
jgi:hypothetical protein